METDQSEADAREPTPTTVPMISMQGVNKHFGSLHVLKDINLEVDRGQVVVVLGPSGSGKSTLCRTINRLEPIDSGTIAIDGEMLPEEGTQARAAAVRRRHGVPVVQPVRAQDDSAERHARADEGAQDSPRTRRTREGDGAAGARRHRQPGRQVSGPAVRRPAAAGGDRPVAGDEPQGDAVRRAHQRARSRDDQRGAGRDDLAGRGGHDDGGGHPRDGLRPPRVATGSSSWPTARSSRTPNPKSSSPTRKSDRAKDFLGKILNH